ncbi:MAG TPA: glycosyltransferase family 2 protein, partial [Deltaproteobacteria bacterium]|nr:glycosyltransferase family 2 protein [Deltaproteobacteria bacterium]
MAPKISVCIPTYNYAHYIAPAIESVLNQRLTDFELIILDDCSKDNTEEAVSRFLNDKRVLFEKNERNLGLVANWNKCISMARGEYIKFVFADDMLASQEVLGLMAGILDSDPSVTLVASAR